MKAVPLLPILEFLPQIKSRLASGNNLVLQAEPGAGKSTALPMSLLDSAWLAGKKILMLEPRRIAAKSIAHYLSMQLGEKVGRRVGYRIKNDRKVSKESILEIVTEGILTRRLQADPEISDIGLIIFDEFHERSIHADFSLMLALEIQAAIRQDLKLLVMSATIDTALISNYMGDATIIECPGRAFPVSVSFINAPKIPVSRQVVSVLRTVLDAENSGDTLVFLPGQAEIRNCLAVAEEAFKSRSDLVFLPLFGALSIQQQERALLADPEGNRRIVFTTNIAETSLTIEGITCVIDSGLEKVLVYDPSSYMTRLETAYISKASAEQRKGRAGRTQAGSCIRLWDRARQQSLRDFQGEEILSADLSGLVLDLFLWGEHNYERINWLTPPPKSNFESAKTTLLSLGLVDSSSQLTPIGRKAAGIGLPVRLAAMLLQAESDTEKGIACELSALLSERDIFTHNKGADIIDRLLAVQDYRKNRNSAVKAHPIKRSSVEQLLTSSNSLRRILKIERSTAIYSLPQLQNSTGELLLYAYPDRLARRRSHSGRYQLANGKGVFLYDDDPLFGEEWLVIANCDAQKKEGRIFSAAPISLESIVSRAGDRLIQKEEYGFDKKKQKVTGRWVTRYGSIEVKSSAVAKIPAEKFQACLLQILQADGFSILNWTEQCAQWLARAQWLGENLDTFSEISKERLIRELDTWLLPYVANIKSIAELKKVNVFKLLPGALPWDDQRRLEREAPTHYLTPANKSVPIIYHDHQGPTVSIVLQEMFGEIESPKIAGGRIPLRFELLSPARRPIQTTSDLANFWKTSYFDVAKDMKGRYPRHRWPEQPLLEKPGKSIKRKGK